MKKLALGLSALAISAVSASAADMAVKAPPPPPAPVWNWTGFYIGANGGWGWSNSNVEATTFQSSAGILVIPNHTFSQNDLNGAVFGGQVGYNWQVGPNWLIGVEGDFDGANINKSSFLIAQDPLLGSGGFSTDGLMVHTQIQWLASIRGRVGWTAGPNLFYVTGGGAWEQINRTVMLSTDTASGVFSTSNAAIFTTTKSGWVAGLGYERMITPNWIVGGEYLHYGFNSDGTGTLPVLCTTLGASGSCGQIFRSGNNHTDVVRLRVSYKFDWGALGAVARY